jgi:hypothetical protein
MADQEPLDGAKAGKQTAPPDRWTAQDLRIVKASWSLAHQSTRIPARLPAAVLARGHV